MTEYLRVIKGNPTEEELAALLMVLRGASDGQWLGSLLAERARSDPSRSRCLASLGPGRLTPAGRALE